MTNTALITACPTCQKAVRWSKENQYRPFCSHRCRLIDLGEWANETRRIEGEQSADPTKSENPNDEPEEP